MDRSNYKPAIPRILGLISILCLFLFLSCAPTPKEVYAKLISSIKQNQAVSYPHFFSKASLRLVTYLQFTMKNSFLEEELQFNRIVLKRFHIEYDRVTEKMTRNTGELFLKKGQALYIINFIREADGWKIDLTGDRWIQGLKSCPVLFFKEMAALSIEQFERQKTAFHFSTQLKEMALPVNRDIWKKLYQVVQELNKAYIFRQDVASQTGVIFFKIAAAAKPGETREARLCLSRPQTAWQIDFCRQDMPQVLKQLQQQILQIMK